MLPILASTRRYGSAPRFLEIVLKPERFFSAGAITLVNVKRRVAS